MTPRSARIVMALAVVCGLAAGCRSSAPPKAPAIVFTVVPPAAESGGEKMAAVAGRVTGGRTDLKIVLFAKSAVWWVQPFVAEPLTNINADFTWSSRIHLGTDYAALLVEPTYQPPATTDSLPSVGGPILAVAEVKGSGNYLRPAAQSVTFSGFEWEIRHVPSDRGGANDYDSRNVWVDDDRHLHLLLTRRDDRWTSAEARLMRSLGYGTYSFVVRDSSHLDPAASLGLLTWDDLGADQNHREFDIELGRWGNPSAKNAQYVLQPHYVAANVFKFDAPSGPLTHEFRWEPGRLVFKTTRGNAAGRGPVVAERTFTSGVPVPGSETIRMNLLYFRGSPTPPAGDVEAVIERFEYLP